MFKKTLREINESRIQTILQALEGLEFGTLHITVHDSQITQIERTEKKRFPVETVDREDSIRLTKESRVGYSR